MNDTKRQILPPGLWVVATPIGNLGDITQRAIEALKAADFILCEDTRRTSTLFAALQIPFSHEKLKRCDAHTEARSVEKWVDCLKIGKNIALVTDAGTPGVSDPGSYLVSQARSEGIRVTPIPGPSSVTALLSVSGFVDTAFTFRGYFPRKIQEQERELKLAASSQISKTLVWFESPLRIRKTLLFLKERYPDVKVVAVKEMTKLHETFFSGNAQQVASEVEVELLNEGEVGEWAFAVQFPESSPQDREAESDWAKALQCLLDAQVGVSEASRLVSQYFGISKRISYESALSLLGKKTPRGD